VLFDFDITAVRLTKGGALASVGFLSDDGTDYYHKKMIMTRSSSEEAGSGSDFLLVK